MNEEKCKLEEHIERFLKGLDLSNSAIFKKIEERLEKLEEFNNRISSPDKEWDDPSQGTLIERLFKWWEENQKLQERLEKMEKWHKINIHNHTVKPKPERSPTHCPDEECSDEIRVGGNKADTIWVDEETTMVTDWETIHPNIVNMKGNIIEKPKDSEFAKINLNDLIMVPDTNGTIAQYHNPYDIKEIESLKSDCLVSDQLISQYKDQKTILIEEITQLKTRVDNKCQRIEERDKIIKDALEHIDTESETIILIDGDATPYDRVLCVRCSDMEEILEGKQ